MKERSYEIISYIFSKIVFLFDLYVLIKTYASAKNTAEVIKIYYTDRLNMELDLQSLLGSMSRDVRQLFSLAVTRNPPPRIWAHILGALLVS